MNANSFHQSSSLRMPGGSKDGPRRKSFNRDTGQNGMKASQYKNLISTASGSGKSAVKALTSSQIESKVNSNINPAPIEFTYHKSLTTGANSFGPKAKTVRRKKSFVANNKPQKL